MTIFFRSVSNKHLAFHQNTGLCFPEIKCFVSTYGKLNPNEFSHPEKIGMGVSECKLLFRKQGDSHQPTRRHPEADQPVYGKSAFYVDYWH